MTSTPITRLVPVLALALTLPVVGITQVHADTTSASGTTLSAVNNGNCTATPGQFDGTITVTNGGGQDTQNLAITVSLIDLSPTFTGTNPVETQTVDVSAHPVIAAGTSWTYSYSMPIPSMLIGDDFKVSADITITNHSGHLGTAFGPSPDSNSMHCSAPTASVLSHTSVTRVGSSMTLRWTLALRQGVIGFNVYAGHHKLNSRLIALHTGAGYRFHTHTVLGPYVLHVLFADGRQTLDTLG
jgi:hypothetical protein